MSSKSAESFGFLTQAVWATDVVTAASQVGVLDRLDSAPATSDELVSDLGLDPDRGRLVLIALEDLGLVAREDGVFRSAVPGVGAVAARLLRNGHLAAALTGEAPRVSAESTTGSARLYPDMVRYLASGFQQAAAKAAGQLARPGLNVLDLGAGAAPWSLAFYDRCPDVCVVAVDLPDVIPATEAAITDAGCKDRFELRPGDLFDVDLEAGHYDLVLAGGICHLFDEPANSQLLAIASRALRPGGTMAIFEPLINESLDGPRSVVLYALDLGTRTHRGGVRPFSTYVSWLTGAGLQSVTRTNLSSSPPMSLITAHKPREKEM